MSRSEKKEFRNLEHMTDALIEAYGSNIGEAFENAGRALEDIMVEIESISPRLYSNITVRGTDESELLYAWLESLIFKQDTENLLFSEFHCKILKEGSNYVLKAVVGGEKYDPAKHEQKTAVKAPTYHEMEIDHRKIGGQPEIILKFLLDL